MRDELVRKAQDCLVLARRLEREAERAPVYSVHAQELSRQILALRSEAREISNQIARMEVLVYLGVR